MSAQGEKEFVDVQEKKSHKKGVVKEVLDGSLLVKDMVIKQLPFVLFLTLLAMAYIANRYHAEKIARETSALKEEVKHWRAKAITISSDLMYISKQSEVQKMVSKKGLNLVETEEPPKIIKVKPEE